jgi:hypothetical protein
MRLFDATSTYLYIFFAYALNALFLLFHSAKAPTSFHGPPDLLVLIPKVASMVFGVALSFASIRKTSSLIERVVLILTGALCCLFLVSVLSEVGFEWAGFPRSHSAFVIVSCAAAVLAGIRVFQLMRFSKDREAL